MAYYYCGFKKTMKSNPASFVLAAVVSFATIQPATASAPGVGMCEFTGAGKYYYSAIFDVPNDNDRYKWEQAWVYYVLKHVDPFPGNGYCQFYRTRAAAQQDLQIHKNQAGAKLIETGWVYTGPEQLPPPAPPNPGIGR